MKGYEEYRDTGIQWFPLIPSKWGLKLLSQVSSEQCIKKAPDEIYPVMTLTYGQIARKKNVDAGLVPSNYDNYQMLYEGNIVLRLIDLQNDHTSLRTGLVKETGIITSAYTCIMPKENPAFLQYLLHSYDTRKAFYGFGGGVRQSIGFKDIKTLRIPVPSRAEQDQIVRYLDWQVSKINRLIAAKRKQIDYLQQMRRRVIDIVIEQAKAKGDVIQSPFPWIGAISKDWTIRTFGKIASVESNLVSPTDYPEYQQISPACIEKHTGIIINHQTVRESGVESANHRFFAGQILYSKIRPRLNKVTIAPYDGLCSAEVYPIETSLDTRYLKYFMLSSFFNRQYDIHMSDRARMPKLNVEELSSFEVIVPSKQIQMSIVDSIENHMNKMEKAIESVGKLIQALSMMKTRLISDVVTGQIDVRGIGIPDFDFTADTGETDETDAAEMETEDEEV